MSNRRKQNRQTDIDIKETNESLKAIARNTEQTSKNTDEIKNIMRILVQIAQSKVPTIIGVATLIVTIIGIIIANNKLLTESSSNESAVAIPTPTKEVYTIYLYPEYRKFRVRFKNDMTATLNFNTDSVSITAYLNSEKNGETVIMTQKNSEEWQAKVQFKEAGTYEVIATATAPDGTIVEGSVEVEVY